MNNFNKLTLLLFLFLVTPIKIFFLTYFLLSSNLLSQINSTDIYPLHVGDIWHYLVEEGNDSRDTTYYITSEIVGKDTINGKEYFLLSDGLIDCYRYIRIDSSDATVWEVMCNSENECMIDSLSMLPDTNGFFHNDCYGFVYCTNDTSIIIFGEERHVKAFQWVAPLTCVYCPYRDYQYAEGIGQIYSKFVIPAPEGFESEYRTLTLTYAKIDGVEYGKIDTSHTDFFPLHIGNRWQFSENGVEVLESKAIGDTTMANGITYVKIQGALFSGYYRKEVSKVYKYNTTSNKEELIYDFSLKIGDTLSVKVYDQDTIVTTVSAKGTSLLFDEERQFMTFLSDDINSSGDFEKTVFDGIGYTNFSGEVLSYGLTGAVINGISYGNIVSVQTPDISMPDKYSLSQNYPNPFNPSTTIKYTLPFVKRNAVSLQKNKRFGESLYNVTLKVYDILGREVATLVNEQQKPGSYNVKFNASKLNSGIYFYRLLIIQSEQTANFSESKKMILLK